MEQTPEKKKNKVLSLFFRIAVAVIACFLIFKDIEFKELADTFKNLHLWVFGLAVLLQYLGNILIAFRWWILLRSLGIVIPLKAAIRLHFHGLFFSNFLPSSIGGDLIRAWYVTKHYPQKKVQAALSVFVDRVTGLVSTLSVAVITYFMFLRGTINLEPKNNSDLFEIIKNNQMYLYLGVALLAALVLIVFVIPAFRRRFIALYERFCDLSKKAFGQLFVVCTVFIKCPWVGPFIFCITVFLQSLVFLSFWAIGSNLGVTDEIKYYFFIFPLVWVLGSIPVSIAGIGILEGGIVLMFMKLTGSSHEAATAMALCQRLLMIFTSLPGVWIHLRAEHLPKTSKDIFIDEKQVIE